MGFCSCLLELHALTLDARSYTLLYKLNNVRTAWFWARIEQNEGESSWKSKLYVVPMCSLEDTVVWILINCKRRCTSSVKLYTNTFATDTMKKKAQQTHPSLPTLCLESSSLLAACEQIIECSVVNQVLFCWSVLISILTNHIAVQLLGKIATSRGFVPFVFVSWRCLYCYLTAVLLVETIWRSVLGSTCFCPLPSKGG